MRIAAFVYSILLATTLRAQSVTTHYETTRVAEGIVAFIAPEPRSGVVNGNTTVIVGDGGVVVVDPGQFPTLARRQIAEIRRITDQPVRFVVNTHWHWDHNLANAEYRAAFPGVTVVSTNFTREFIRDFTPGFLEFAKNGDAVIARLRANLEGGKKADGSPMSELERQALAHTIEDFEAGLPELRKASFDLPDLTFTDKLELHLGSRLVEVRAVGRANTAGDAIVWVPDARVVVTGDLVVHPTPYATSAYPAAWAEAMQSLLGLGADSIVPGHGPVQRNHLYVERVLKTLRSIADQARRAVAEGLTLEQTRERIDLEPFRQEFAGEDPVRRRAFDDYFAASVVASAWREAKGEPIDEAPMPRKQ